MRNRKQASPFTRDDLAVIARLLRDEQDHSYRDRYTWGPNGVDQARWLRRVGRVRRKVAVHQLALRPPPPIPF